MRKDDDVSSLPENVEIETGRLTIRFQDMEELAQSLWKLAQIMEEDLEGFAAHYEPADVLVSQQDPESELEVQDALWITQWLKEHE